jgi:hypothetical protein
VPATRLAMFQADVLDCASIRAPVEGANAMISCIGPPNNLSPGTVVSQGMIYKYRMLTAANDRSCCAIQPPAGVPRELSATGEFRASASEAEESCA